MITLSQNYNGGKKHSLADMAEHSRIMYDCDISAGGQVLDCIIVNLFIHNFCSTKSTHI